MANATRRARNLAETLKVPGGKELSGTLTGILQEDLTTPQQQFTPPPSQLGETAKGTLGTLLQDTGTATPAPTPTVTGTATGLQPGVAPDVPQLDLQRTPDRALPTVDKAGISPERLLPEDTLTGVRETARQLGQRFAPGQELTSSQKINAPAPLGEIPKLQLTPQEVQRRKALEDNLVQRVRTATSARGLTRSAAGAKIESDAVSKFLLDLSATDFERARILARENLEKAQFNLNRLQFQSNEEARQFSESAIAKELGIKESSLNLQAAETGARIQLSTEQLQTEANKAFEQLRIEAGRLGLSETQTETAIAQLQADIDSGKFAESLQASQAGFNRLELIQQLQNEIFDRKIDIFNTELSANSQLFSQNLQSAAFSAGREDELFNRQVTAVSQALQQSNIDFDQAQIEFAVNLSAQGIPIDNAIKVMSLVQQGNISAANVILDGMAIDREAKNAVIGGISNIVGSAIGIGGGILLGGGLGGAKPPVSA